jgi:hypothetical protein
VRDRLAAVQALLENGKGEIRLRISHACKRMIECLELQCYTEKGDPDKDAGHDHMNDALGYVIWREFNPPLVHGRGIAILICKVPCRYCSTVETGN